MEHREVAEHSPGGPRAVELAMNRQRLLEKNPRLIQVPQIEMNGRQIRERHPLPPAIAGGPLNRERLLTKSSSLHDLTRITSDDTERLQCLTLCRTIINTSRLAEGLTQLADCFGHATLDVKSVAS
jgi:hypothetical protein